MPSYISPASEFPNDNPELHDGAIWVCVSPCAMATAELPTRRESAVAVEIAVAVAVPVEVEVEVAVPVEVAVAVEVPVEVEVAVALPVEVPVLELAIEETIVAAPDVRDEEDEAEIEIVDDLDAIEDEDEHADDPDVVATTDGAPDPFSFYVQTLTDVMIAAGGSDAAAHLVAALSDEPTACAWRRIITGESEDFTACGAKSLDEWSAELVARLIAMPGKTDQLRRELRSRGVAAFGLVVD